MRFKTILLREQSWLLRDDIGCHRINPDELENPYLSYHVSQPFFIKESKLEHIKIIISPFELDKYLKVNWIKLQLSRIKSFIS